MVSAMKNLLAFIVYSSGLFRIILRARLKHKAVVLMYHQIISDDDSSLTLQPGMLVRRKTFENHIKVLREYLRIISLPELLAMLNGGEDISGCCVITFDDGWKDFYENAFPALKIHGADATVFLATGFIGSDSTFWFEEVRSYLMENLEGGIRIIEESELLPGCIQMKASPPDVVDVIIQRMKDLAPEKREELLMRIRSTISYPVKYHTMMEWNDAIDMMKSGLITFGAHTVSHVMLDQVDSGTAEQEIVDSLREVDARLKVNEKLFSYPNGNYNEEIVEILKRNNVACAVTTQRDYVDRCTDVMKVPRIAIHEDVAHTTPRFLARITLPGF